MDWARNEIPRYPTQELFYISERSGYGDKLMSKEFFEASSTNQAFKIEFQIMMENGGPKSFNELSKTYNLIHSPGAKLSGY